jgi:gamma-glutamylcyclotransferase (GGCT)/AIG2-like uncharacterized protein YtfP
MPLLFSYGTLQQHSVQLTTFGRRLSGEPDALPGFEPSAVPIEDPQLAAASGRTHHANVTRNGNAVSRVSGMVFEVSEEELTRADRYEGEFLYRRVPVLLASGREAWVYLHAPEGTSPSDFPSKDSA